MHAAPALVALLLTAATLGYLPEISVRAEKPSIDFMGLYLPASPEDPVVMVFPDYGGSSCPTPGVVDYILGEGLDKAFRAHTDSMIRFVGEFGQKYAKLILLRFEKTDSLERAGVIVRVEDVYEEPGAAGGLTRHYSLPDAPVEVYLDCDLPNYGVWMDAAILHELYHALRLGHVSPPHPLELMGSDDIPPPYPSSLVALALFELWFSGKSFPSGSVYTLPDGFPYVVLLPYHVTVEELEKEIEKSRSRIKELAETRDTQWREIIKLRGDVQTLREQLEASKGENEALRAEVERLTGVAQGLEQQLAEKRREAEELRSSLAERERQVASLAARVAELQQQLERSEAWGQAMFFMLVAVVPVAIIVSSAVVALRGRGGKW